MTCSCALARSHSSRSRRRTSVAVSSSSRAGCLASTLKISNRNINEIDIVVTETTLRIYHSNNCLISNVGFTCLVSVVENCNKRTNFSFDKSLTNFLSNYFALHNLVILLIR